MADTHGADCECLACKLRHWRSHGMNVSIPQDWSNRPTMREMEREIIDTAKADGRDIALADDKYRWM